MNLGAGSEDRKKAFAVGGFLLVAALVMYFELRDPGTTVAPTPTAVAPAPVNAPVAAGGTAAKAVGKASNPLDPTLHMDAMLVSESLEYSGSGRNIFSMTSAPPIDIPKPVSAARVNTAPAAPPVPCPPNCPPPPPPPPIDLKFFGVETATNGTRQACLLHGDDVILAHAGDVVVRRYRVITVDAKSIQVEDLQNNNKQTLPLQAN
jgi:hypothetical protein